MTDLKDALSAELTEQLAAELGSAWPDFDSERFSAGLGTELRPLEPGAPVVINRTHRFAHASIRRIYLGRHTIDVWVNGRALGSADLIVRPADV